MGVGVVWWLGFAACVLIAGWLNSRSVSVTLGNRTVDVRWLRLIPLMRIPYSAIEEVRLARPSDFFGARPLLGRWRGPHVYIRRDSGFPVVVVISPDEPDAFIRQLRARRSTALQSVPPR